MASKKSFSISAAVSYGWKTVTKRLGFFVVLLLIIFAANFFTHIVKIFFDYERYEGLGFIMELVSWVVQLVIGLGSVNIALRIYDRKKAVYKDLLGKINLFLPYFIASVIYLVIVVVGFILLIVPGIIWSIKFRYYVYFMVDKGLGPIDALKASSKLTQGVKWHLFFLGLVLGLVNIIGVLCLVVGLFVTIPLTMMAEAYVFRKLQGK